jgi:enoyl-CoA hydratase
MDLNEINNMNQREIENFSKLGQQISLQLEDMDIVTIAAINGKAYSGGLDLALACDYINASETAEIGSLEVSYGLIPGFGGTQRLARIIGVNKAKEMIYSAKKIDAKTALNMGLFTKIFPKEELIDKTREEAEDIAKNSFYAIIKAKKAINMGTQLPLKEALLLEQEMFTITHSFKDRKEGIKAFIEKRKPDFTR